MLTRTPEEIALSETSRLCQQIADLCGDVAEQTADGALKRLMARLIEEHHAVRARVDALIRASGDLPRTPDPDLETVKELATRVKKVFASDPAAVLLDERIADEEALLKQISEALELDLKPATRDCLEDARRTASEALRALKEERARHAASQA